MQYVRTPEAAFKDINFPFEPQYLDVKAADGAPLRMHYIDEGPRTGKVILCLHGQPSWSFLYRKLVGPLTAQGYRVIAPDLIGFGKSDKPVSTDDYSYTGHVDWVAQFVEGLILANVTGLFQDWGGMIGLRLVERLPSHFDRVIVANTMLLDTQDVPLQASQAIDDAFQAMPIPSAIEVRDAFASGDPTAGAAWVKYATQNPNFSITDVFSKITGKEDADDLRGYDAPFPDRSFMAGAIAFPLLFPIMPHHESDRKENARVWKYFETFSKPLMTAFSDGDPVTAPFEARFRETVPGARGVEHVTIKNAGHYLFDEQPEPIAKAILQFLGTT